jgi:predicted CxxxxCH...CXXCH cytochrome family protein
MPRSTFFALLCAALTVAACDKLELETVVRPIDGRGGAVANCVGCHGDATRDGDALVRAAPPAAPLGGDGGAHLAHLTGGTFRAALTCAECHYVPTLPAHADGNVAVPMTGLARIDGATPSWDAESSTCSGVYCHGATLGGGPAATPPWSSAAALGCTSCHGAPPPAPHTASASCGVCHAGYTASTVNATTHLNGAIDASGGHPAGFSDPTQHGYLANRELATCRTCHGTDYTGGSSGVSCNSCHGGTAWQTSCTFCHGTSPGPASPPVDTRGRTATSNVSVGAHAAHVATTMTTAIACTECHPNRAGSNVLTDAAHVDGDGRAEVVLGTRAGAGATYARVSDTSATCSSTYCHGAGPVEWTSTAPLGCTSCHDAPPPAPHTAITNCGACHDGYTQSSVNAATHLDGTVESSGGHADGYDVRTVHGYEVNRIGLTSCKTCHGTELASCNACHPGGTAWQTSCTFCHGNPSTGLASPPVDTEGGTATANVSVGAHAAHAATAIATPLACRECHPDRAGSNVVTDAAHLDGDGRAEVVFGTRAGASATYTRASDTSATCASTHCHGANAVEWTSTAPLGCTSCHGAPPPGTHTTSTNCDACHPGYTQSSVNPATHVNGTTESSTPHLEGYLAATVHGYEANSVGLASCASCHGTDLASCNTCHEGTAWQTSCTFCHGNPSTGLASPPVDTRGRTATANVSVGAHAAHVATTMTTPLACTECHPDRAGSNVLTDAAHMDGDGRAEVVLGTRAGAGATYARASDTSATCSSTYCHGANPIDWTSTAPLGCASCHGAPPAEQHTASTSCGACHTGYTQSSVYAATHLNGTVEVSSPHLAGYSEPAVHGYEVNRSGLASCKDCHGTDLASCSTCHASMGFADWQTSCTFCHGNPSTGRASPPVDTQGRSVATNVSVGVHASHVATTIATPVACTQCHADRTGSNVVTDGAHIDGNGVAEISFGTLARTGGAPALYNRDVSGTSATCASTYCHGRFTGGATATVSWTSTAQVNCSSCHGNPPNTGKHLAHATPYDSPPVACYHCHNAVASSSGGIGNAPLHVNGTDNVGFGGTYATIPNVTGTWNASTRQCSSVSCHGPKSWPP